MEKKIIVANWKENITVNEAQEWMEKFRYSISNQQLAISNVVICPSFVVLPMMAYEVSKLEGVKLGAQDVSKFEEGQYTGEVSAKMLRDFVSYVIVGHSERRRYFGETNADVNLKVEQCLKYDLTPIVCVSNLEQASMSQYVNESKKIIFAYEPLFAVGSGKPDTPENAAAFAKEVEEKVGSETKVLYGGSVNSQNVSSFVNQLHINGVLVGQSSLDAAEFTKVVFNSA